MCVCVCVCVRGGVGGGGYMEAERLEVGGELVEKRGGEVAASPHQLVPRACCHLGGGEKISIHDVGP